MGWGVPGGRAQPADRPAAESHPVAIKNFEFAPRTVTIAAGESVRWTNGDVANHQVSSGVVDGADQPRPDGRISSPLLFRGDAFSVTFRTAGQYPYYCRVHPFMRAAIVVTPSRP